MAWRCSSFTNEGLVENLKRAGIIQSKRVVDAMKKTDRAKYVGPSDLVDPNVAYQDSPQPIGHRQTISAPHMHAYALELADTALQNVQTPKVLDVGAGSGYLTACLGRMVEHSGGQVYGVELIPELVSIAKKNLENADRDLLDRGIVSVVRADGWKGLPNHAPFHFIHVGAAAEHIPDALLEQLAEGGRLVVPIGPVGGAQTLVEFSKINQKYVQRKLMSVSYVPLVHERTEEL